jgi:hypothetical protein
MLQNSQEADAELTTAQRAALGHVEQMALRRRVEASDKLRSILKSNDCTDEVFAQTLQCIRLHARVVLHFHPDRIGHRPITVAQSLLEDGQYRSQFETGLSSGSRTAFAGGERDQWENNLFGGAYHQAAVSEAERPKYGALELIRHADGPIPRFGSCYFILHAVASSRATFTYSGSEQALASERCGTINAFESVMLALLTELAAGKGTAVPWPPFVAPILGVEHLTVASLLEYICTQLPVLRPDASGGIRGRVLDTCIEAQVHGRVDLHRDVEYLVMDPSFKGTAIGATLQEVCTRYDIKAQWHPGFRLLVNAVPDDFRGPAMRRLAQRIAPDGMLDAAVIGAAEATLHSTPAAWSDYGTRAEILQHLKQLWHVLVHYGDTSTSGKQR